MRRLLLSLSALSYLAACGGGGGDGTTNPPPATPTISVSASSSSGTVARGASTTTTISVTRGGGFTGAVSLTASGAPSGVTVSFAPASIATGSSSSTATISVDGTATPGSSTITITASGSGVSSQTASYALTIPTPAITVTAGGGTATTAQGTTVTVPITVGRSNGASGAIDLSATGAPANTTVSFAPASVPATETASTMSIVVGSATAVGTYTITVSAAAAGVTTQTATVALTVTAAATPGYTVVATPAALSIVAGQNSNVALALTRTGGFAGNVTLALEGAPAGVTGTFAPNPVTAGTSALTLNTTGAAAAGTYNLTVRGTAATLTDRTITVALTITQPQGFTLSATNSSVVQGSTGTSTVTIARSGGLASNVDLTAANLPANVSASFAPASVAGTTSTLTFTATGAATPGTYTVTVNGTATGASNQSTTLSLTVQSSGGGGGAIAWRFCDPARIPLWFAYRDGASGTWTRVTAGANNTYSFTINSSVGGVAYVQNQSSGGYQGVIMLNAASEFASIASQECTANAATKTLNATFAGLTTAGLNSQTGSATIAGGSGSASASGTPFQIQSVQDRVADVYAYRTSITVTPPATITQAIDKIVLRRNVNYPANGTVPVIDFEGAESFVPASATITLANAGGDQTSTIASFQTTNGFAGAIFNIYGASVLGVPANKTQAGDFHLLFANASVGSTAFRSVYQYNRDLTSRTLTFGNALTLPSITTPGSGRVKVSGNWQSEYGDAGATSLVQGSAASTRTWTINASRGYFGTSASQYEFELSDFSGVAGYLATWNLATGTSTQVTTTFTGVVNGNYNVFTEGYSFRTASRVQTTTP